MLIELYLFLSCLDIFLILLSFFQEKTPIIPFLACGLAFPLAILSWDIEIVSCRPVVNQTIVNGNITNYINDVFCARYVANEKGLSFFWFGLGIISLAWAIVFSMDHFSKPVREVLEKQA